MEALKSLKHFCSLASLPAHSKTTAKVFECDSCIFRVSISHVQVKPVFFESIEHPLLEIRPSSETSNMQNHSNTKKITGLCTPSSGFSALHWYYAPGSHWGAQGAHWGFFEQGWCGIFCERLGLQAQSGKWSLEKKKDAQWTWKS